jgi:hypothetical protein
LLPPLFTTAVTAFRVAESQALNTGEPGASRKLAVGAGRRASGGACGSWRAALVGAELAEQFGGGLVGDAEAVAERVASDLLAVLVLVLGGGVAGCREEGLVLLVLDGGRPSWRGQVTGIAVLAGDSSGGPGAVGGAALDHGDRDQERAGGDGGHDAAPGVRLGLGEVGARLSPTAPASTMAGRWPGPLRTVKVA